MKSVGLYGRDTDRVGNFSGGPGAAKGRLSSVANRHHKVLVCPFQRFSVDEARFKPEPAENDEGVGVSDFRQALADDGILIFDGAMEM